MNSEANTVWIVGLGMGLFLAVRAHAAAIPKPVPLIQIGVEVVEVDEQKTEKLGINWINSLHLQEATAPALFTVGTFARAALFADLEAMISHGTADLLANPKLVTRDGTTATFHAGGEIPYAVSGTMGSVTIEFKPYGINLKINPHVEPEGRIALIVDAEVSGPDQQNSVSLAGNTVPGIRSRQVTSELTLDPGTTLTLAGLIQNQKEWKREGLPLLSKIPLLGYLFSHKVQTTQRMSIVVFVTPTLLSDEAAADDLSSES